MNRTVERLLDSPSAWVVAAVLIGLFVVCLGCAAFSPTQRVASTADVAGTGSIGNLTVQSTLPLGMAVIILALVLFVSFTAWLSHRREMRRIYAKNKG